MKLYNTLSKTIEEFKPIVAGHVNLYTCGPTVYNFAHIGNLRTYIFEDLLKRSLQYNGYQVKHAMNITDVGHLVGDGDEGEDKLEVGAKREGKNPLDIAKFYTEKFFEDTDALNIFRPDVVKTATETIPEQIEIIKILVEKGFAYLGKQAVYFDTSKLEDYGKLSGQKLSEKLAGARGEVVVDNDKKHPADFTLWFFLAGRYQNHILHWPSPWGEGFPGWHIECSAISRKILGQPFDIHCGGVDHIGTHHTNEIAQSEAAFGFPLANVWMHGEFLQVNEGKMAKSAGSFVTLQDLKDKGFSPLDYRYMCLQAHYRTQLNFSWESVLSSRNALEKMYQFVAAEKPGQVGCAEYEKKFLDYISDDLNVPQALGLAWQLVGDSSLPAPARINSLIKFDKIFGFKLLEPPVLFVDVHENTKLDELVKLRQDARNEKDFAKSDQLRQEIEFLGYEVLDTPEGQKIKRKIRL